MHILEAFDLDAVDETAFKDNKEVSPQHLQLIANLRYAAANGDLSAATEAFTTLRYTSASPSTLQKPGNALEFAIDRRDERMVAYLLSEGVRVGAEDMRAAVLLRAKPIIRLLLDHGWPINAKLGWYEPPAMALAIDDLELVKWFLSLGADPNAPCGIDITPLSVAVHKGPFAVIDTLFAYKGTVNRGQLLHWAALRRQDDRLAVVKLILQKGAAVNAILYENDEDSFIQLKPFSLGTPLHEAARVGHLDVVQLLLDHGADVTIKDTRGDLPYDVALENGHHVATQLLML